MIVEFDIDAFENSGTRFVVTASLPQRQTKRPAPEAERPRLAKQLYIGHPTRKRVWCVTQNADVWSRLEEPCGCRGEWVLRERFTRPEHLTRWLVARRNERYFAFPQRPERPGLCALHLVAKWESDAGRRITAERAAREHARSHNREGGKQTKRKKGPITTRR